MRTVTVGLCVKNSERTVKDAVDSIISQDYSHEKMEILVVDGGSRDATLDIVSSRISMTNIRSRICSDRGKGLGVARQIVVDQACGNCIIYIGSDVILPKDFVRKQVDFMENNLQISAAMPQSEYNPQKNLVANIQNLLFCVSPNFSNGTIFRTQVLKEVNGFDIRIKGASEDRDIMFRIKKAGFRVVVNPEAIFYHGREETLRDVYTRYSWYGYGDHFIYHRYDSVHDIPYYLPPPYVAWGFKLSLKAYAKYQTKKSFLIPFLCLFASISWCLGFLRAHKDGYGHSVRKIKRTRINKKLTHAPIAKQTINP